jgi:hypothetical protein
MAYGTERRADSGYQDGRIYTADNTIRLHANLDDSDAPVHAVGGLGDEVTVTQADRFAMALDEINAVGASIYDWSTLNPAVNTRLAAQFDRPNS